MKDRLEKKLSYNLLIVPPLLVYLFILFFPILASIFLAGTEWKQFQYQRFVGIQNFVSVFKDEKFYTALRNNIYIMLSSVFWQIPLGLSLAYILFRKMIKGVKFYEVMIFLPVTISAVVVALLWNRIFSPVGIYTSLVRQLTGNPDYVVSIFENRYWAMLPILFTLLWMHTSLYMIIFLANMQRLPKSIFEAATLDGVPESLLLLQIVIPALSPVIFTSSIFAIAGSLKSFDLVYAMTGGGPVDYTNVLSIYLYDNTFTYSNYGKGSAISLIIVILSVGFILLLQRLHHKAEQKYHQ